MAWAIAAGLAVGQMVVPDDLLDMTRARVASFELPTLEIPSGTPFNDGLRQRLVGAAQAQGFYVCDTRHLCVYRRATFGNGC